MLSAVNALMATMLPGVKKNHGSPRHKLYCLQQSKVKLSLKRSRGQYLPRRRLYCELPVFEESRTEFLIRWHVYRRWRRPPNPGRKAEYKFYRLMDSMPRGGLFVDLGANVGNITFQALKYGHHVIAVEPDPTALVSLRRRFGHHPRVEIVPKAVGSSSRKSVLFRRPDVGEGTATESSSLNETGEHRGGDGVEVEVLDIVQFFQGLPERPAIVKMDIEGAEAECLEALLEAGLHRSVGAMLVETHERFSSDIKTRLDLVRARLARDCVTNIDLEWA